MRSRESLNHEDAIYFCTECGNEVEIHAMSQEQFRSWLWHGKCIICQEARDGSKEDMR